ncbi:MAG: TlpA family protein disulfide reductase [Aquihabitans sp.]
MTSPKNAGAATSRNGAAIWIGVGAVIVVLGLAAVFFARGSGSDDEVSGQTGKVSVGDASTTTGDGDGGGAAADSESSTTLPVYDATLNDDPAVGMTIPTVTGKTFSGDDITISGDDGKAKVILFVAHWCPHCQREVPLLKAHLDDNPMPDDVELLTVSTSVKPGADNYPPQEWLEGEGWSAPVLADDEDSSVAQAYGLSAFPYFVVVDEDGKVVERASGELTTDQFDAAVAAAQG